MIISKSFEFKFDRTPVLERTPAEIAEDLERQQAAAEKLAGALPSTPATAQYHAAFGAESAARADLEQLLARIPSIGSENDREQLKQEVVEARRQYASALFWQGKFEEAALFAPDVASFKEYSIFRDAFAQMGETLPCACKTVRVASARTAKGTMVPAKREIQRIFCAALGAEVKFIKCEACRRVFASIA